MAKLFRTAIMGPPGSGKGTISKRIAQNFGLQYLSSGHFLREGIAANTDAGVLVKGYVERSMLVPDHLMSRLMLPRLEQLTGHSWLLDGFPRTIAQAKALNDICQMDLVISLNIPFETLRERGRDDVTGEPLIQHADDRPEALQARLRHYKDVAKPVMNLYKCLRQEKRITQQRRSSKQTAWFPVPRHPVPVLGYRHRPHLALHQLSSQH
ncbi:adenylate kinase 4, mitochondrial isoform X4 [Gadus chalcogrammus]|uniref:adenylate kinase 4, mitochondrial isoform X4 n=1 Tax=Gadus chalcogrammus TaxID=1042646 RepID=UPI0024C4D61C|nr:adenylate kinase 4, mitochondrial isoform X4 [Gadus chalcogrammus]